MFDNVFDKLYTRRALREHVGPTAREVQRIFDGCLKQGLAPLEAVKETEILCNIRHLRLNTYNDVIAYVSNEI